MNIKFLISLALSFCIISQNIQAETKNTGSVSGKVLDKGTQLAIDYVNVILFKKGSDKPYKVKDSDTNGSFTFTDITPGIYRLETKLLGYLPYKKEVSIVAGNDTTIGDILLKADSKLLKSVEVTGIRSNMKLEIDKRVFSVNQSISAAGASASDILKDIPSVDVDAEGTISLRNSASVTVWINGKPSGLTADNRGQVLEQMPAESIDRIEVITNPSAKFSSEGSAGIINIILKKNRKSGYYGSLMAGVSNPWGTNFGGNFNYSSSKIDVYANIGQRNDANKGSGTSKRQTYFTNGLGAPDTSYLNNNTNRTFEMDGLFLRGGVDYHLNDKHTISLSGFAMDGNRLLNSEITYDYLNKDHLLTQKSLRKSKEDSGHGNYEMTVDYLWEIGKEHSLQANLEYGERTHPSDNVFEQTNFDALGAVTGKNYQKQPGPSSSKDVEFKMDYSNKISEKWKIEAGINSEISKNLSENRILNGIASGNDWIIPTIPAYSNGFDSNEQIHAMYGTFTGKTDSAFGYQLGLRGEYSNMEFVSTDLNSGNSFSNHKKYLDLFPTIFLNYKFSEGSDIQLNYSKRINRPHGRSLNPFVNISDSTNIWIGNPDLNPEYTHAFELNFIKSWTSHTLSSSLYHRITNGVIQDIRYIDKGVMYQTPSNVTNSKFSGMEFVSKNRLTKMIETTSTLNLYYGTMDGFSYRNIDYKSTSGFSWNAKINGTLTLSKGFSGQISGFYSAPIIIAQGETKGNYSLDMGLRKNFLDGKFQLSINARNLLNSFNFDNTTWGPDFYQETSNHFFSRNLRLNLTWNFGNLKPKKKPGKGDSNENATEMGNEY